MNDGKDRRRTDTEAARVRRQAQQQQWERDHPSRQGPDHISEAFAQALGAVITATNSLPLCDRAAKLYEAVTRLANAPDKAQACVAAQALVKGSNLALGEDPWYRLHVAATEAASAVCEHKMQDSKEP